MIKSCKKPPVYFPTVTGDICSFNSQYAGLPLKSHSVEVVATQSGSGTPSPDNVRSINGHSAIGVAHSNRNILPYTLEDIINANGGQSTWTDNQKTINGMTFTLNTDSDGKLTSITIKNTATSNTAFYLHSRFTSIYFPASTLYSGVSSAVAGYSARISHPGGQIISSTTAKVAKKTYSNCDIILFFNGGHTFDITVSPRLILSGESDNSYVPHEGTTTTIQIGSTVYGGEYDARTGVLTVTHEIVDLDTLSYSSFDSSGGVYRYYARLTGLKYALTRTIRFICSCFKDILPSDSGYTDNSIYNYNNDNRIIIATSEATDTTELQALIQDQKLVYELATPTTIQLPPCLIDTLEGVNNIFCDTGNTTLEYLKAGR